ncbi:MAG: 50S ribosomal protein L1 [Legionellaceae bacterium]|nr:50S ribosomal protein L1 [Legionellaceae bacterium]
MSKLSKKQQLVRKLVDPTALYSITDAVAKLKEVASKNFKESVDLSVNLGVDPRKSDQVVRSATSLPKGTGRTVRVAVFAQGDNAEKAKAAGADIVGFEDLAEDIKAGNMDFDVLIATPDAMRLVGQLGQILGPRGLMPNPKVGTVTPNVAAAVQDAKSGQARYRTDKNGIIHCAVGSIDFSADDLNENVSALIKDLMKLKPSSAKGVYLKKITLSTTMGPGIAIDLSSLNL